MRLRLPLLLLALTSPFAHSQHLSPRASFLDVPARQQTLATTTNPLLLAALHALPSCVATPAIPAPPAPMDIPHHYLSGSSGPINPAEAIATRPYTAFERRITAGMNQYVATNDHAESACALAQLHIWAQANALVDYPPRSQSWYQVEWTLGSAAITTSVLVNDPTLDPAQLHRVITWLDAVSRKDITFERPEDMNNHHYWRALAAIATGVVASDDTLFHYGITAYKDAIAEIDPAGAFPREMARHENAIHYQGFALTPLILIAQFADRQGTDLYAYQSHNRSIRDAVLFYGRAIAAPSLVKPYTSDPQKLDASPNDFAAFNFYASRFPTDTLPPSITDALQHPTTETRIGGNTTILAAHPRPLTTEN
ncbi:MAG TPA: alginate lyase family protein [Acidobacteriaceae bacterium]|jgi:poly(beta-D-mannuronate) lyase|nr:alginate lyase family protein [Acidobacteriaceae bacterium]